VHPWGVQTAKFDSEALRLGKLKAYALRVRLPDGTLIDTESVDRLPAALALEQIPIDSGQGATLVLCLPLEQANGGICLFEDARADRPVR
ncbi:type VI secretion system baseplate subunit TssK, partial [Pseudomonas graminis]|uniref:type VI secretion system baseplate subunit TssK n=1 Tax=Pseudomonas graminis TaxID=158627 RepID=UPI003C2328C5